MKKRLGALLCRVGTALNVAGLLLSDFPPAELAALLAPQQPAPTTTADELAGLVSLYRRTAQRPMVH